MKNEMVAPSELHRKIEMSKHGISPEDRWLNITDVLNSENLAVIRRIFELEPFDDYERETILEWASGALNTSDVSKKDFIFHLLVNCKIDAGKIMSFLEIHKTLSRSALEHLMQVLGTNETAEKFNAYQKKVASDLLETERVPSRDRARHILITLAKTETEWLALANELTDPDVIYDLRQTVLERFLRECNSQSALETFVANVLSMCNEKIKASQCGQTVATSMHWVMSCHERMQNRAELVQAARLFKNKFIDSLPLSVKARIQPYLPKAESEVSKLNPRVSNPEPYGVEDALRMGWAIRKDNGKQVVLVKDGRSITRYRS